MSNYIPTVGVEVHVELKTNTKIFSPSINGYGEMANSLTNVIDLGYPGTLPTLNEEVVNLAIKAATVLNCKIRKEMHFDRKNYFYPDIPKNYQITQSRTPIGYDGYLEIEVNGEKKKVYIEEMHIEEDTCKSAHRGTKTLLDFNRAGVPLIEIVSEPDIRSAQEAESYVRKLKSILEYIEVSDCKMQEGSLRADVNVSIRKKGTTEFGTRTEMKNMNSFRSIVRGIEYEVERQIDVIESGGKVEQETLRWDDVSGKTFSMRDKEDAEDYRYFPDPDLVAIKLSEEYINKIKEELPELPESRKTRYLEEYKLTQKEADTLTSSKYLSDFFEEATKICKNPKTVCNWMLSDIAKVLNEKELEPDQIPFSPKDLAELISLIEKGTISGAIAKKVLDKMFEEAKTPETIIKENGWVQISDEGAIKEVVEKIITQNPQSVADYKAGKEKALGFLVGQAMKETKGKANPQMLNTMFKDALK